MSDQSRQGSPVAAVNRADALTFEWGTIKWLVNDKLRADSRITFGVCEIKPGLSNPRHYHPNCDEVLFMLEGEIDHRLGDDVFHLAPGMALHIPTGTIHNAVNRKPTMARVVIAYSSGDRQTVFLDDGQD